MSSDPWFDIISMYFIFPFAVDKALNYLWAALSSDQLAGQPFCDYVRSLQNDEAFANIRFWTAAQQFLASSLQMDTMTRKKQARALLHIYLLEDSPRKTCITPEMQTELCEQLPKDSGFVTLNTACWECAKVCLFGISHEKIVRAFIRHHRLFWTNYMTCFRSLPEWIYRFN